MGEPKPAGNRPRWSDASKAVNYGISGAAARLNERLGALARCRWTPLPDGEGLAAKDRRGRPVAVLLFEEPVGRGR
jgi:hypothetical protein